METSSSKMNTTEWQLRSTHNFDLMNFRCLRFILCHLDALDRSVCQITIEKIPDFKYRHNYLGSQGCIFTPFAEATHCLMLTELTLCMMYMNTGTLSTTHLDLLSKPGPAMLYILPFMSVCQKAS